MAAALDALEPGGGGKRLQQLLAEHLVADAVARKAFALKMILPLAFALDDNEESDDQGALTAREQELIDQFSRREQSADSTPSMQGEQI